MNNDVPSNWMDEVERLRNRLVSAEAYRDSARAENERLRKLSSDLGQNYEALARDVQRLRRIEEAVQRIANHADLLRKEDLVTMARAALADQPTDPGYDPKGDLGWMDRYAKTDQPTVERPDWTHEKEVLADDSAN